MPLNFVKKLFIESNVHGIGLVFKSKHLLIERLLWIVLIGASIYLASDLCRNEWTRYQYKSVVLSLETNHRRWEYLAPAVTMCTDIFDEKRADELIEKHWNVTRNDSNYMVYRKFVSVVTHTTFTNLQEFRQFLPYPFLNKLDMLQIAKEMREYLLPDSGYNLVVTEMGVCFSSTYLHYLQNVTDRNVSTVSPEGDYCRSTLSQESCNVKVLPPLVLNENDVHNQTLFIHNKDDVLNPVAERSYKFYYETVTTVELVLNAIVSSNKLKQLSSDQRKCYFPMEISLKYFKMYTVNLCLISCRIDAAVRSCGCVPFFYRINNTTKAPVCNVLGMICLSTRWFNKVFNSSKFDKTCDCLPLCNSYNYKRATVRSRHVPIILISSVEILIRFPKSRLKRVVVYTADNLLVAVGGAFGFYLGCSFMSAVEFVYFFLRIFIEIIMGQVLKLHT